MECEGLMRMMTPCTDSNNAECVCDYGFYKSHISGQCEPCTMCLRGEGIFIRCQHEHDAVCEQCVDDTYSDQESSLDPCLPCTLCDDGEIEMRGCSPIADAICFGTWEKNYFTYLTQFVWQNNRFQNYLF